MHRTRGIIRYTWPVLLVAVAALTSWRNPNAGASEVETPQVVLGVRVHLLHSPSDGALDATFSDADVAMLFDLANEIWKPAGIRWRVQDVVQQPAPSTALFQAAVRGGAVDRGAALLSVLPKGSVRDREWDVFVVRDLGTLANGVYIQAPEGRAIIFPEVGSRGRSAPTARDRASSPTSWGTLWDCPTSRAARRGT